MCSWCGWEHPSLGLCAALRLRGGFSLPRQKHRKDTYNLASQFNLHCIHDVVSCRYFMIISKLYTYITHPITYFIYCYFSGLHNTKTIL